MKLIEFDPKNWRDLQNIRKLSGDRFLLLTPAKSIFLEKGDHIIEHDGFSYLIEKKLASLVGSQSLQLLVSDLK